MLVSAKPSTVTWAALTKCTAPVGLSRFTARIWMGAAAVPCAPMVSSP
jgi:hypothetical protein